MISPSSLTLGTRMDGGFFVGLILLPDGPYGLLKAPKAALNLGLVEWGQYNVDVPGARSPVDGPANTLAMADSSSDLARRIVDFKFEGLQDFYLPAQDELEVMYRTCKPTAEPNSPWTRSGINLHAHPAPTRPYANEANPPQQTEIEIFRAGGAEAFETDEPYWTSTQHAGCSDYAWDQWFNYGYQDDWRKDGKGRACLVRRFKL